MKKIIIVLSLLFLWGCSGKLTQVMTNPITNDKRICSHWYSGWGVSYLIMKNLMEQNQRECINNLKSQGYVEAE